MVTNEVMTGEVPGTLTPAQTAAEVLRWYGLWHDRYGRDHTPKIHELAKSHERLREALSWAVGFIRCNMPKASAEYPDMRNAEDLVSGRGGLFHGEFSLAMIRAELAEHRVQEAIKALTQE